MRPSSHQTMGARARRMLCGVCVRGGVAYGVELRGGDVLTPFMEVVRTVVAVEVSEAQLTRCATHMPLGCPAVAVSLEGERREGFYGVAGAVPCIDGVGGARAVLSASWRVEPLLLAERGVRDAVTLSTARGVWLVPKVFAERVVDSWSA